VHNLAIKLYRVYACYTNIMLYVDNSLSKLKIQVATYVFELSAGNCHR